MWYLYSLRFYDGTPTSLVGRGRACSSFWVSTVMPPREFLRGSQGRILSGVAWASLSGEPICPLETGWFSVRGYEGPSLGYPCYLPRQYGLGIILDKCAWKIFWSNWQLWSVTSIKTRAAREPNNRWGLFVHSCHPWSTIWQAMEAAYLVAAEPSDTTSQPLWK